MEQPSSKVLNHFSLQGPFTNAINGDSAQTFLSECFVVQARPEDWLDCGNLLYQTSQTLLLPGLNFTAKPFLCDNRVWTVQRRLPVVSETTWSLARERLPGWDAKDWRLSVTIYLLREMLYFPLADEKANLAVWSGLGKLSANN